MLRILEIILSWLFPVYWEVNVTNDDTTECSQFPTKRDAENYAEFIMSGDTGKVSYVTLDKYINARPDLLIKVNRFHKGWSSKFKKN